MMNVRQLWLAVMVVVCVLVISYRVRQAGVLKQDLHHTDLETVLPKRNIQSHPSRERIPQRPSGVPVGKGPGTK